MDSAESFLLNAEKWEAPPLLPIATELQAKAMKAIDHGGDGRLNIRVTASMAMLRARHGDTQGLEGFALQIQKTDPAQLEDSVMEALEPFWRFPDHSALRTAVGTMFGNTNSAWGTLAWLFEAKGHLGWNDPVASPLLVIPEIRKGVIRELANVATAGEAIYEGEGRVDVKYADGGSAGFTARKEAEGLETGTKVVFRRCDLIAQQLAAIPGFPKLSLLWPEPRRDDAMRQATGLLLKDGHRLRAKEKPRHWSPSFDPPLVEFAEEQLPP